MAVHQVQIRTEGKDGIEVEPERVVVTVDDTIEWVVRASAGDEIVIDFPARGGVKGPLKQNGMETNPERGRFCTRGGKSVVSGICDLIPDGPKGTEEVWKYDVICRRGKKGRLLDPEVAVRK